MEFEEYDRVALKKNLPEKGLKSGDIGTIVEKLPAEGQDETPGVALEVFNAIGDTQSVIFVSENDIRPLRNDEVQKCTRRLGLWVM